MRDARTIEGGHEAEGKIRIYLEKRLKQNTEIEEERTVKLLQKTQHGEMPVEAFDFGFDDNLDDLIEEIIQCAEKDAEQYPKKTRYCVRIEGIEACSTFSLNRPMTQEDEEDDSLFEQEIHPTKKGLLGQMMDHTQNFADKMMKSTTIDHDRYRQEIRDLKAENVALRQGQTEMIKVYAELFDMDFARKMKVREMEMSEDQKRMMMGVLMKTAPMLVSKYLGTGAMPEGSLSPTELVVDGLIASLENDPTKIERLMNVLDPIDVQAFAELYRLNSDRKKAEQQAKQQANQDAPNANAPTGSPIGITAMPQANGATHPTIQNLVDIPLGHP